MVETKTVDAWTIQIYIAGDYRQCMVSIRRFAMDNPTCMTISPCHYVFVGGAESGVVIGLRNYPRFPSTKDDGWIMADNLARELLTDLSQVSCMITDESKTVWLYTEKKR